MKRLLPVVAVATLSACVVDGAGEQQSMIAAPAEGMTQSTGWRAIVSSEDNQLLARLPKIWRDALAAARRYRTRIRREGALLAPDAARNHPVPPPGSYHCRLIRIGAAGGREPAYRSFPEFFCYVRGDRADSLFFAKQTGTELPGGYLHQDGERRLVLTGALQHAATDVPITYGTEPDRDLVGVVERVGPFRWRLVLPWRGETPGLDIYEFTPVPLDQQAPEPPAHDEAPQQP